MNIDFSNYKVPISGFQGDEYIFDTENTYLKRGSMLKSFASICSDKDLGCSGASS